MTSIFQTDFILFDQLPDVNADVILLLCLYPRRYASLYFCCAIEEQDNELITLEIIHRFVELLDKYFGSVSHRTEAFSVSEY